MILVFNSIYSHEYSCTGYVWYSKYFIIIKFNCKIEVNQKPVVFYSMKIIFLWKIL